MVCLCSTKEKRTDANLHFLLGVVEHVRLAVAPLKASCTSPDDDYVRETGIHIRPLNNSAFFVRYVFRKKLYLGDV